MEHKNDKFTQFSAFLEFCNNNKALFIVNPSLRTANQMGFYKNGSKIHIKKLNKGKFTDYCNGKVTSECIRRGKNSSDPKIRKRATFAENARKWKHLFGGTLSLINNRYVGNYNFLNQG